MAAKKKTYRRPRARKHFYRRKKAIYSNKGTMTARFVKVVRVMVLNNMQGAGDGYYWFNFGAQTTIHHSDLNIWTMLNGDADFTGIAAQYLLFKPYGVSITAIPSNMNVNATDARRDCTALISVQPVRKQVNYNMRKMILDPFTSTKMYWKVGSYTSYCYCNPTAEQQQIDNNQLIDINLEGNSGVQPYQVCPAWTIRITFYVKFKSKQSD